MSPAYSKLPRVKIPKGAALADEIDALNREPIRIDHVDNPVCTDAQAVVLAAVKTFSGYESTARAAVAATTARIPS